MPELTNVTDREPRHALRGKPIAELWVLYDQLATLQAIYINYAIQYPRNPTLSLNAQWFSDYLEDVRAELTRRQLAGEPYERLT